MKKVINILGTTALVFLCGLFSAYMLGGNIMKHSLAFCVGVGIAAFAIIIEEARNIDFKIEEE